MAKFFVTRRSCSKVHFATRASNLSQNFHAKLICSCELLDIMTSVLDLKNPKNRKMNNNRSVSDILDGDSPVELETEPLPIWPANKYKGNPKKENDFLENFETPQTFDKEAEISNNLGDMTPLTTLASLAWTAPDKNHELISHTLRKWIIVILVAVAFAAFFWQGSILTAITFFALALVTSMHFWREAAHHQYEIHPHGIVVGDQFYHYHDLDSFWIHYHPKGHHELSLCTGNLVNHYIKIPLGNRDPFMIRDALMMYLPEERHEEGLEDWLRRKLGL